MSKEYLEGYYGGLLYVLSFIADADKETMFRAVVDSLHVDDKRRLIAHARRDEAMEWSGLARYGYGKRRAKRQVEG